MMSGFGEVTKSGTKASAHTAVETTLVVKVEVQRSRAEPSRGKIAALLMRTSSLPPWADRTDSTAVVIESSEVMSRASGVNGSGLSLVKAVSAFREETAVVAFSIVRAVTMMW